MATHHRVFVAFAGGGAKALIHVGALRALEQRDVAFKGLAGTSAGALVATLKAAGFNAKDLIDPDTGKNIVDLLEQIDPGIRKISDIFGAGGWQRVKLLRVAIDHPIPILICLVLAAIIVLGLIGTMLLQGQFLWAIGAAAAFGLPAMLVINSIKVGLARLQMFRTALAKLLQQKMFPDDPKRTVLMKDFGSTHFPTLRIVSANLSTRRLHLFSPERTPDVPVADAVAASISLPIVFRPESIADEMHMDGGIVSNLPAWPFDEERELDGEATTIAIEIASGSGRQQVTPSTWIRAFVGTALFGSGELNLRAAGRAELIALRSSLTLLDFDLTLERARQEVRDATEAAATALDDRLFTVPDLYRDACKIAQVFVDDTLDELSLAQPSVTRVAVAIPDAGYHHSLRLRYSVGYEPHGDEGMLLPIKGSVAGAAFQSGKAQLEVVPLSPELDLPGDEHRLRRKARRADLEWIFCIPIFLRDHDKPAFVVVIDGDEKFPETPAVGEAISSIERQVTEVFKLVTSRMGAPEKGHGLDE